MYNKNMKKLIKVNPEALLDTTVEIRFSPRENIPSQALFGMMYASLKNYYPNTSVPQTINLPDNLKIKLEESQIIFNDKVSVHIGNSVIIFNSKSQYPGWTEYFDIIAKSLANIINLDIFKSVNRVGLRYVSFFEDIDNIFEYTNFKFNFENSSYHLKDTNIATVIEEDNIKTILRISDNSIIAKENKRFKGSLTDIDSSYNKPFDVDLNKLIELLDKIHNKEKEVFSNLIIGERIGKYEFKYNN